MNASRRAGVFGGARVGKPRCAKILMITEGSSIAARMGKGPLHCGQMVIFDGEDAFESLRPAHAGPGGGRGLFGLNKVPVQNAILHNPTLDKNIFC